MEPVEVSSKSLPRESSIGRLERDIWFKADIGGLVPGGEEVSAGGFEQFVDLDPRNCFVHEDLVALPVR